MDISIPIGNGIFNFRSGVVLIDEDRVLLHKKEKDDFWALPGGRVSMFESSAETAVREIHEEIGVEVVVERLLWHTEKFFPLEDKMLHEIADYYLVKLIDFQSIYRGKSEFVGEEGDEVLIYQWFPIKRLKEIELYPEFLREDLQELPLHPVFLTIDQRNDLD
ncbi:NUDIX hydrolase [Paucisalibacillus globulus]|uniref:NUDIX hydrolase n=1 Tax=Paucisalibacillus globulus TaxID=351095 RepID=UPI00040584A8|nr:NUDIX domain-containing protein [Paucisalibacillus globulus]